MFQNIVKRVQKMVLTEEKRDIQEKEGKKLKTFKREADRGPRSLALAHVVRFPLSGSEDVCGLWIVHQFHHQLEPSTVKVTFRLTAFCVGRCRYWSVTVYCSPPPSQLSGWHPQLSLNRLSDSI